MISLLDANVLIALFDAAHVHHQAAHQWFAENRTQGWATCPLTENACIRILSQPAYPGRIPIADIVRRLRNATKAKDHSFWPDDVRLCDPTVIDPAFILTARHLTDIYLLALASRRQGKLVTFDKGIPMAAVPAAQAENLLVL